MHKRLILLALFALCGCSEGGPSRGGTAAPTTRAAEEEWHRYDDARYSADERQAVRAATEVMLDPSRPRPDFDQAFRYSVSTDDADWFVTVWHVYGFADGKPQFVPGGHTFVILDQDFNVKSTMPGA